MDSATSSAPNAHNANGNPNRVPAIEMNLSSSFGLRVFLPSRLKGLVAITTSEMWRSLMSNMSMSNTSKPKSDFVG